ncbi:hypothetical protein CesoFtcFv8_008113 [Champsocephalus esox]|nr:hypothetical protein CesoFtcFv8_008113 [Champsocephalus esox]
MEDGGQRLGVEVTKEIVEEGEIEEVIVGEEEEGDGGTVEKEGGRKDWSEEGESGSRRERSHSGSETGVSTRVSSRSGREDDRDGVSSDGDAEVEV